VLRHGEFVARVRIPVTSFARDVRSHKVARRFDDDISTVSATFAVTRTHERIEDVRVVLGGMATTVRRALTVEDALRGALLDDATLASALSALRLEFTPITDHRASAGYRMHAAEGLLHRWWREITDPLAAADVWAYR
jgi:xanthine dehydrogenase small subunit